MSKVYHSTESKILTFEKVTELARKWRSTGQSIVFTNGCFDLIHLGHIEYLEKARQKGDTLIVGVNTDKSIRLIKGSMRPIKDEYTRCRLLAALQFVDAVVLFDELTPLRLIQVIRPNFLVKGGDYTVDQIVGADFVLGYGGYVETIELVEGYSTTNLIETIQGKMNPDL